MTVVWRVSRQSLEFFALLQVAPRLPEGTKARMSVGLPLQFRIFALFLRVLFDLDWRPPVVFIEFLLDRARWGRHRRGAC